MGLLGSISQLLFGERDNKDLVDPIKSIFLNSIGIWLLSEIEPGPLESLSFCESELSFSDSKVAFEDSSWIGLLLCLIIGDCKLAGVSSFKTAPCLISLFGLRLLALAGETLIIGFYFFAGTIVYDLFSGLNA